MSEYISREELIDRLRKTELSADQIRMLVYPKEAVVRAIYDCTSADVRENIHARWIKDEALSVTIDMYKCSCCSSLSGAKHYNFCPHCGAVMDKPE